MKEPYISQDSRENWGNRGLNLASIFLPWLLMAALALGNETQLAPTATTLLVFAVFFAMTVVGVAIGMHRYFTHHAFKTSGFIKVCLGVLGTWAMQGDITRWVADHRRHHRFADKQFDPHSPWYSDHGPIPNRLHGWFHAHMGWMIYGRVSQPGRYAPDCLADRSIALLSRYYWPIVALGLVLPGAIGYLLGGEGEMARCVFWAGAARVALLHQLTWSVNSFGHLFGQKVAGSDSEARDNIFFALLLLGEGLHSHHHWRPASAINEPKHLDFGGWLIRGFEKLGLVWHLR
ncbi:acyl-CoA desaturase [Pseudoduganella sp. S-14]|jgi:stearoyl-CoA desaturase (Delta-9 desaturase)|uniref:acyl-CoA desaturase n=1 Tax=Pseudoduganella sp. S-14 TaxID=3404065 RepID=UPI003CEDF699